MTRFGSAAVGVIVGYAVLYLVLLGVRPLVAPDEVRYAEIPREMVATGEWVVPHLNGLLYYEKPVMGYWVTAVSLMAFGENRFAVRFPFALATGVSMLIIFGLVRRFGGGSWTGLAAAAVFGTSVQVYVLGTCAILDALLATFLTATMASFYLGWAEDRRLQRHGWLALCGVCCGLAFLTKGFLAFAVPAVAIGPFLLWQRRWRDIFKLCWTPAVFAALVALPWSIAIAVRDPGFWKYFFWEEHVVRFASLGAEKHAAPFWYLIPFLLLGALPWTGMLVPAGRQLARSRPVDSFVRYCICWVVFPLLFFSASSGKLGTYVQPCFAPLVMVLVVAVSRMTGVQRSRELTIGAVGAAVIGLIAAICVLVQVRLQVIDLSEAYTPGELWKGYVGVAGLLTFAALAGASLWGGRISRRFTWLAVATAVLLSCGQFVWPTRIDHKVPEAWLEEVAERVPDDAILVAEQHFVHAVCWILKRDDVLVLKGGELDYGADRDGSRGLDIDGLKRMIADPTRDRPVVLITRTPLPGMQSTIETASFTETSRRALLAIF